MQLFGHYYGGFVKPSWFIKVLLMQPFQKQHAFTIHMLNPSCNYLNKVKLSCLKNQGYSARSLKGLLDACTCGLIFIVKKKSENNIYLCHLDISYNFKALCFYFVINWAYKISLVGEAMWRKNDRHLFHKLSHQDEVWGINCFFNLCLAGAKCNFTFQFSWSLWMIFNEKVLLNSIE